MGPAPGGVYNLGCVAQRWPDIDEADEAGPANEAALSLLIRELLLERTTKLDGPTLAAFIDGWTSVLDLLARVDLLLPAAPPELRESLIELVRRIRQLQQDALADDDLL